MLHICYEILFDVELLYIRVYIISLIMVFVTINFSNSCFSDKCVMNGHARETLKYTRKYV